MTELNKATQVTSPSISTSTETGVVLQMADGTIAACNAAAERLLGMTISQLQDASSTSHPWQAIHPDGSPFPGDTHPAMVALQTSQPRTNVEMGFYKPNGELVWFKLDAYPLFQRGNDRAYAVSVNITPIATPTTCCCQPSIDSASPPMPSAPVLDPIGAQQEHLLSIIDTSSDYIGCADLEGRALFVNRAGLELVGLEAERVTQTHISDFIMPEDRDFVRAEILPTVLREGYWQGDFRLRNFQTEAAVAVDYHVFLLKDVRTGEPTAYATISRDLRGRLQAELAQIENDIRLRCFMESNVVGIIVANLQGDFLDANDAFLQTIGYSRAEFETGRVRWIDITPPEWNEVDRRAIEQIRATGSCLPFEKEYIRKDGSRVPILAGVSMLPGEGEECFCFVLDLSERKRAEAERAAMAERLAAANLRLEHQNAELLTVNTGLKQIELELQRKVEELQEAKAASDRANLVKEEFLAVLSHELRSPLSPILGWSKLIKNRKIKEDKLQEAATIIERNAQLQAQLIEDLLDISRILQGKLSLNLQPVNLEFVVAAAIETVKLAAQAKQITITTELEPQLGLVMGDTARLQQVMWNLLSNAIKFTPTGGTVAVRASGSGDRLQIQVTDTGKGISPEFLPHVFERFRQEDGSNTRKFGGLGLGLAIVRQLVESHGGSVLVESNGENCGATFTVWLPLLVETPASVCTPDPTDSSACDGDLALTGYQILVVDDDADSRDFISFVLEQSGAVVTQTDSAMQALDCLSSTRFSALVSDIGMPEMNGYMLMQQVRSLPRERGGQIPALALTAYAGVANERQATQAGFERHLAKPIDPSALVAILAQLCAESR